MAQVHVLEFLSGKYTEEEFALGPAESYIAGRSTEADLVLADDSVSRKHARFYIRRGRTWVRDLGSRNGTVVNGTRIERHCLRPGDRIAIGASLARVVMRDPDDVGQSQAGEKRKADESAGRSMSGSIQDIPLVDVLQWLATSRKTGTLKVRNANRGRAGELHMRDGQLFFARIEGNDELHPEKSLLRMLSWTQGMFELESGVLSDAPVEIEASIEHMLMEAARQQDELANLASKVPLPKTDSAVELANPSGVRWRELEPEQLDVVQDLAERGDWWALLDASEKDDVTMMQLLADLKEKGVVEYES